MFDHDLLAELPAPHDDEPPSLRSEIVDELLDHLQCAFRREVLKDGDEGAAEKRVLDRFGDPKKLARRLWRQAMWSRIMGKRILSGLQWLLTLAAVFLAGAVFWQQSALLKEIQTARQEQRAEQQALAAAINRLPLPPPSAPEDRADIPHRDPGPIDPGSIPPAGAAAFPPPLGSFGGMPQPEISPAPAAALAVKLVQETENGPAVSEAQVTLRRNGLKEPLSATSEVIPTHGGPGMGLGGRITGRYIFSTLELNRYELLVRLSDGSVLAKNLLIRDDKPVELTILCPAPRKKVPVLITVSPLPEDLRDAKLNLLCSVHPASIKIGEFEWSSPTSEYQQLSFDTTAGKVTLIESTRAGRVAFTETPENERVAFLHTGPVEYRLILVDKEENAASIGAPPPGWAGGRRLSKDNGRRRGFGRNPRTPGMLLDYSQLWEFSWPREESPSLRHAIESGESEWKIALPEEFLAEARKLLAERDKVSAPADSTAEEKPFDPPPGDAPRAKADSDVKGPRVKVIENEAKPPLGNRGRVIVRLAGHTKDRPAVPGAVVELLDEMNNPVTVPQPQVDAQSPQYGYPITELSSDSQGRCVFEGIEPGRYFLKIRFSDGRQCRLKLPVLRAGKEIVENVVCPPPVTKTSVLVTVQPIPDDLRRPGMHLAAELRPHNQKFEGHVWTMPNVQEKSLIFQPETGQLIETDGEDLSDEEPKDRLVFLPSGPYELRWRLRLAHYVKGVGKVTELAVWRRPVSEDPEQPASTADAGEENYWDIKLADEFWETARKKLAEIDEQAK